MSGNLRPTHRCGQGCKPACPRSTQHSPPMDRAARQLSAGLEVAWSNEEVLSTPKLSTRKGRTAHYYAGFADAFVADVVGRLPESTDNVLDPWNGAGTTTSIAAAHGIDAQGFDINPAAAVLSKARVLQADV